jgi:hypothetical protein
MVWLIGAFVITLLAYTSDGRRWVPGSCEINIAPHLLPAAWQNVAQTAMAEWTAVAGGNFKFVADPSSSNTITSYDQGSWNGRLANTLIYPISKNSVLSDVRILINTYWHWDPVHPGPLVGRDPSGIQMCLENVIKHELGHTLYLGHSADPTAIMYATPPQPSPPLALSQDDIAGISGLYP